MFELGVVLLKQLGLESRNDGTRTVDDSLFMYRGFL